MKQKLYSEEELAEFGVKNITVEEFDELESDHVFSEEYESKKQETLATLSRKKQRLLANPKYRIAAAVLAVLLIPATIVAAKKLHDILIVKDGKDAYLVVPDANPGDTSTQETSYIITKDYITLEDGSTTEIEYVDIPGVGTFHGPFSYMTLTPTYLPEGYQDNNITSGLGKYGPADLQSGICFGMRKLESGDNIIAKIEEYMDAEEFTVNGHQGVIVYMNDTRQYDRQMYIVYEEEGLVVNCLASNDLSAEELKKIAEGLVIEPTDDYTLMYKLDPPLTEETLALLREKDSDADSIAPFVYQPVEFGETLSFSYFGDCAATVEKVELRDNFDGLDEKNLQIDRITPFVDENLNLIPYNRTVFNPGDEETMSYYEEPVVAQKKLLYITLKLENRTDSTIEYCAGGPVAHLLSKTDGTLKSDKTVYELDDKANSGGACYSEPVYLDASKTGAGSDKYFFVDLKPGENIIHVGYIVDEDFIDDTYLMIMEDMSPVPEVPVPVMKLK